MLGALAGDIIGSVYERAHVKVTDFPLFTDGSTFTDDSVLTVAVADSLLQGRPYDDNLRAFYRFYPKAGYGHLFSQWGRDDALGPYQSYGNGSAMRVSPVAYVHDSLEEVLREAEASAAVTHDHPDGVAGAQAVAAAVFLARSGADKAGIKAYVEESFAYDLDRSIDAIRPGYRFDATCPGSVPEAIIAFLESSDFLDAIRRAVSLGGDADTQAAIAGAIAEAFYEGVPEAIETEVHARLDRRLSGITRDFKARYLAGGYRL